MNRSENLDALAVALAKAQGEIENATKGSTNDHFRNRYADLAECLNTVRPVFSRHGLSVTQLPRFDAADHVVTVETVLLHSSGQFIAGELSAIPAKSDPQGIGATVTYLRRYSLAAVAGIAQEDDDGNAASGHATRAAPPPPAAAKPSSRNAAKAKPAPEEKPDPAKLAAHLDAIKTAETEPALRLAYANAVAYATACGDVEAQAAIVQAKDKRKAEVAANG